MYEWLMQRLGYSPLFENLYECLERFVINFICNFAPQITPTSDLVQPTRGQIDDRSWNIHSRDAGHVFFFLFLGGGTFLAHIL
jgi:hypothetical protein